VALLGQKKDTKTENEIIIFLKKKKKKKKKKPFNLLRKVSMRHPPVSTATHMAEGGKSPSRKENLKHFSLFLKFLIAFSKSES
jgi:hypothetical protein